MSIKHPIISVTGSSGAGTTSVKDTFQLIFWREKVNAAFVEGDAFHRYDREDMKQRAIDEAAGGNDHFSQNGLRVPKIFHLVDEVYDQFVTRIGTGTLNKIVEQAIRKTQPSLHRGKRIKFYYATQTSSKPPTFVCFSNYPDGIHFSYKRYLINQIREQAGLDKSPLRMIFRKRQGR